MLPPKVRAWAKGQDMPTIERWIVRVLVVVLSVPVVLFALNLTIPQHDKMPGIALGQPDLYRSRYALLSSMGACCC